ncbi:enolase C-terminal domain-like protein [Brucella gallinifaecis]|uniref:enolase C-terminal domain-like protein n=1 Tax=Brucella gallinifaecis TaxID=215590 RepID=UPI001F3CF60C|nr:enolase C-terminal domain-like protein [Brucella gallinifaecis]
MSTIESVKIVGFKYEVENLSLDDGGFNIVIAPGKNHTLMRHAIVIRDSDGVEGQYVTGWGGTPAAIAQVLQLSPMLVGRDPLQREAIYSDFKYGLRQTDMMGIGLLDICLWDLAGKKFGASVSTLLGGYKSEVVAYASTLHGDRNGRLCSPEAYVDFAAECKELGYRGFKVHGFSEGDPKEEAQTVRLLGKAFGDSMNLMLDPSCDLRTFSAAVEVGRACDEANFMWLEDPYRDNGVSQHGAKRLKEFIRTPLLLTEHVRGLEPKADFIVSGATDYVRADPEFDLGITGTIKIAHLAESFGLDVELHSPGPAQRHCISAIRNTNFYESTLVGPGMKNALPQVYTCGYSDNLDAINHDGTFPIPTGPGLGVSYDWEMINKNVITTHEFVRD